MGRECGTRAKYVVEKCRCEACRAANRAYYHTHKYDRPDYVPAFVSATRARTHIAELRASGVGKRVIAERADLSQSAVENIAKGNVRRIRPDTEAAIIGITPRAAADGASVDAAPTWATIGRLLERGWSKAAISRELGHNGRALQLGRDRVKKSTATAVEELWQRVTAGEEAPARERPQVRLEYIELADTDTSWMQAGACRVGNVPTHLFFGSNEDGRTTEAAKSICATCAVSDKCLDFALANRCVGVWGGTNDRERRAIRRTKGRQCLACAVPVDGKNRYCDGCTRQRRLDTIRRYNAEKAVAS